MLSIMLAALLNTAIVPAPGAPAATRLPFHAVALHTVGEPENEYVVRARRALLDGAFDTARREFVIAVAVDRDAGRLPVESSFGLAHVLYAQRQDERAAQVLDDLATEALGRGDLNTAARALNDALWLHLQARRDAAVRIDGQRLKALLDDPRLASDTRREVRTRFR